MELYKWVGLERSLPFVAHHFKMYRLEVLVACYLCCLLIAASTKHPDSSPARPNIAVDEERRSLGEAKLRELERHSEGSPCWKEAVSHLDASCKDITDLQQSRLAVAFANCHLDKSNRRTYPCTDAMTIAECTRDMDPVAFQTYTDFFTHTGHICYFLQSQLWQERTENVITRLSDSSKEALGKLEESLDYHRVLDVKQSEVLMNQDKILDQDRKIAASLKETREYMGDAFIDMREMAENQRMLLAEVFGTLQQSVESVRYLMSLFLVEFVGYETFAFFVAFWLVILFLPRFGYSRSLLHLVLFGDLAMEILVRRIYGYFMFGNDKPPPQDLVSE